MAKLPSDKKGRENVTLVPPLIKSKVKAERNDFTFIISSLKSYMNTCDFRARTFPVYGTFSVLTESHKAS